MPTSDIGPGAQIVICELLPAQQQAATAFLAGAPSPCSGGSALASQTSFAGHAANYPDSSSTTALELTFQLDHRLRAGHHPLLTQKVIAGIHWEALRLWSKRLKVRSRPGGR